MMIAGLKRNTSFDWMDEFAFILPMIVTLEFLGMPVDEHRKVKELADHGVALLAGVNTPEQFSDHIMESMKLIEWVKKQLKEKKKEPEDTNDFTHDLLRLGLEARALTEEEVVSIILQLLSAGNDSSAR